MLAQAVIFTAPNTVEFGTVRCPDPGPRDVVLRVSHSWISNGTEGSYLRGERIQGDTPWRPGDPPVFPVVAGYQKVGQVEWVGADVTDIAVGETVFATVSKLAEPTWTFGASGGHVSPAVTAREQIWKLPPEPDPLAFSGMVLTQVGYNCGARPPLAVGDGAVVLGDGMVGQWAAQTLAWRGARVVLAGHHPDRLVRFPEGLTRHRLDSRQPDWVEQVAALLPTGIQVLVDTVGSIESVEALVPQMRYHGHIVSAGFYGTVDRLALQPLRARELSVDMVSGWSPERMDATRDLIALGYLQTLPLITHHFPAIQAAQAWEMIAAKRDDVLGVVLDW